MVEAGYGPPPAEWWELLISIIMTICTMGFMILIVLYVVWLINLWLHKRSIKREER